MSSKKPLNNTKGRANSPTSIKMMRIQQRRNETRQLRLAGWSTRDIAKKHRIALATVHKDLVLCSQEGALPKQEAEELARLQMARYDEELKVWWPKMLTGDAQATTICLKIQHAQNLLAGLYPDAAKASPLFLQAGNGGVQRLGIDVRFHQPVYAPPQLEPPGKVIEGQVISSGSPPEPPREPPSSQRSASESPEPSRPWEYGTAPGTLKPEVSLRGNGNNGNPGGTESPRRPPPQPEPQPAAEPVSYGGLTEPGPESTPEQRKAWKTMMARLNALTGNADAAIREGWQTTSRKTAAAMRRERLGKNGWLAD